MQFSDDRPGVFIRGDDALGYALALRRAVAKHDRPEWRLATAMLMQAADDGAPVTGFPSSALSARASRHSIAVATNSSVT
jgi:hypothetical protein